MICILTLAIEDAKEFYELAYVCFLLTVYLFLYMDFLYFEGGILLKSETMWEKEQRRRVTYLPKEMQEAIKRADCKSYV